MLKSAHQSSTGKRMFPQSHKTLRNYKEKRSSLQRSHAVPLNQVMDVTAAGSGTQRHR